MDIEFKLADEVCRRLERNAFGFDALTYVTQGSSASAATMDTLNAAVEKAMKAHQNRDRKVFVFRGTIAEFVRALANAGVKLHAPEPGPPWMIPSWWGLCCQEIGTEEGKPTVLCGDADDVARIADDPARLAAAIDYAYPERSNLARSFIDASSLFLPDD